MYSGGRLPRTPFRGRLLEIALEVFLLQCTVNFFIMSCFTVFYIKVVFRGHAPVVFVPHFCLINAVLIDCYVLVYNIYDFI